MDEVSVAASLVSAVFAYLSYKSSVGKYEITTKGPDDTDTPKTIEDLLDNDNNFHK